MLMEIEGVSRPIICFKIIVMKKISLLLILLARLTQLNAQLGLDSLTQKPISSKFEISGDYVQHTRYNNPINTINLHCLIWKKSIFKNYLFASVGLLSMA
jgi:hypothetical protein